MLIYITIIVCAAVLTYFYFKNNNRSIERYYYKQNYTCFVILQISFFILLISLVLNIRYLATPYLKNIMSYLR